MAKGLAQNPGPGSEPGPTRDQTEATLRVNPITCDGHGLCAELLPELIRLDDWGYPIVERAEVPARLLPLARRAADACPTLALLLEERLH